MTDYRSVVSHCIAYEKHVRAVSTRPSCALQFVGFNRGTLEAHEGPFATTTENIQLLDESKESPHACDLFPIKG